MAATHPGSGLLDALFAHAPIGLAFWDAEGRFRRVNTAMAQINGIPAADHLGRTIQELLGPLGQEVGAVIARVLQDGEPVIDVELNGQTPAAPGVDRTWLASYYPVPATEHDAGGVGGLVLEVTAERRATERAQLAVRERRTTTALLDAIFAAAPVGLGYWDVDVRYRRVNEALTHLNGVAADDHLGRTPQEVLGPGALGESVAAAVREVLETGEPVLDRNIAGARADGQLSRRQVTYFPVHGPTGELAGVGGVTRDVTAQHHAEEERNRLYKEALTARAQAEAAQVRAEHARAETERARARAELLGRAGERLALLSRDLPSMLHAVARVTVPVLADRCTFLLVARRGATRVVVSDPAGDAALDLAAAERVVASGDAEIGPMAVTVPLRAGGRTIGALALVREAGGHAYGPDEVTLAESLAVRTALAVVNERLLAERSHIAQTLQRSLLPPALPEVPGLELAARYRASGDQNEVGGDFYDVFRGDRGTWTLVIGDVSGKGAEAAAVTSLTRHTLRAAALRHTAPGATLELLNDALLNQPDPEGRFCTVLLAQVGEAEHGVSLTLATGGHLPPLLVRAGGRVERIQLRGSIVGGFERPSFGEREVHLDPGDLLLMFTDGVTEIRSRGGWDQAGEEALEEVLRKHRGEPAATIVAAVERRAVELQAGEPRDDIALLALRARPQES